MQMLSRLYYKNFIFILIILSLFQKADFNPLPYEISISQCFTKINTTTLEKNSFYYSTSFIKEKCTKLALSEKYKEDIYNSQYLHKCFPLCNSCSEYSKEKTNMKCITCFNGFIFDKEKGNCYINKNYGEKKGNKELDQIFNTLTKNQINKTKKKLAPKRKLYVTDDYDDTYNNIMEREDQSLLTNDMNETAYNFRIELSPYYYLAKQCILKNKLFIENNKCVDICTPHLEYYHGYPEVQIPIEIDGKTIKVCDCGFRCCIKKMNDLYKSLDRGYIDGSYHYFRNPDNGRCLSYETEYTKRSRPNSYLLAQDFVPCFFPIYDDNDKIELYISGYQKTIIGNKCWSQCPIDKEGKIFYYYNQENSGCYQCPDNCLECNDIPTNECGHCIKCQQLYFILDGFCIELCPEGYGEKNGIKWVCEKCDEDEFVYDNKCVKYQGLSYNYGTNDNPSYVDSNNKIHGCMEYVSFSNYILHYEIPTCPSYIQCPDYFINSLIHDKCDFCGKGCVKCNIYRGLITCDQCDEYHIKTENLCSSCLFTRDNTCMDNCNGFIVENSYECVSFCGDKGYTSDIELCLIKCEADGFHLMDENELCLTNCPKDYPENINGECENCPLLGSFNSNGTCVKNESNFDEMYFILPGEENKKYGRVGACYIIDKFGNLRPEHYYSRSLDPTKCQDNCPSNYELKYDENGEIYCKKCYETCSKCNYTGTEGNHKCLECKEGYEFSERMYHVCDQICTGNQFFWYEETREKKCGDVCPSYKPYALDYDIDEIIHKECIKNCTDYNQFILKDTFYCVNECPEGYILKENICFDHCQDGYGLINGECVNCKENNMLYYNHACYEKNEVPLNKYVKELPNGDDEIRDCFDYEESDGLGFKSGFNEQYNNCPLACPEGYFLDNANSYCYECEDYCFYCDHLLGCMLDCPYFTYNDPLTFEDFCVKDCPDELPFIKDDSCIEKCNEDEKVVFDNDGKKKCEKVQCKAINEYYNSETNSCHKETNIPKGKYFDEENQPSEDEYYLSPCLIDISDTDQKTGFSAKISNCERQCNQSYYYLGNNTCRKCHKNCNICFDEGTDEENNCYSCIDRINKILNPYLYNCEPKCEGSFHYDSITKEIICDTKCGKGKYIDETTGNCILLCNKLIEGNYCVNECSEGFKKIGKYCLEDFDVPVIVQTIISTVKVEVEKKNNNSDAKSDNKGDNEDKQNYNFNNKDLLEIIKLIERNITQYIYFNDSNIINNIIEYGQIFNNENNLIKTIITKDGNISLIEFYPNNTEINIPNSPTIFYFPEILIQKLKEFYPLENSFYFMQIDLNETKSEINGINFLPQSKYKIFLKSGEEININDLNPNMFIILEKDFYFSKKLKNNLELALYLLQKGINVFDINDPFFQDICYKYKDENGNDVILKNRKEDYYQNIVACINGCEFLGINYTNYKIQCKCKIDVLMILNEDNNLYNYLNDDYNINNDNNNNHNNLEVIKCYEESFNKKNILNNKGLWVYLGFLLGLFLLYICFLCYDFDPLYSFLYNFTKNNKNKEEEIIEEEIITKKEIININKTNKKEKESFSEIKENPPKKIKNDNNKSEISKELKEEKQSYLTSNFSEEKKESNNKIEKKKTTYRINFEKNEKEYPKLNISNFGKEGYKLSNKFDKLDLNNLNNNDINNLETIANQESQEFNYNIESPKSPRSNNSLNESPNSPSSESSFYDKKKFIGREVDLEPEGALLESNNFFDTCRIVKLPKNYNNILRIQNKSNTLSLNNKLRKNNNLNNFYRNKQKKVKLPGFPRPTIEEENENPINRKNNLDDITENDMSEKSENIRKEIYNQDFINESDIINDKNIDLYHNYKNNLSKKLRTPYRNSTSSLRKSTITSETFRQGPITINKYYITNNTSSDDKKKENNYLNEKNSEKITTISKKKKLIKNYKNIFSEFLYKYDIDIADFECFLNYEKRKIYEIYTNFLSNFQIFLSIFLNKNIFVPFNIRGGITLFTIELYFTGIALFTTFTKLEKRYKYNKAVDILYLIQNDYDIIIYTSLISKFMNLITMYFLSHYSITNVIKEYAYKENIFLQKIKNEIFWLKFKYHAFFIICIILTIVQGYYITCFCGIFEGAIKPWIFTSLITISLNFALSFIILLLATIFRKIALWCQSYIIFLISKLIIILA